METLLMRVRTTSNEKLSADEFVHECMTRMMQRYPQLRGYSWERLDENFINILMYGDFQVRYDR